jgi:hypothetical protein
LEVFTLLMLRIVKPLWPGPNDAREWGMERSKFGRFADEQQFP